MNKIGYEERKAVYEAALQKWGAEAQINKFTEELGEFLVELGRLRNGASNRDAFAEELADLTIMLEQLRLIYGVNEEICEYMDYKIHRLMGRIGMEEK